MCLVIAAGGEVQLEQLDDAGREWFGDGPSGQAIGWLGHVLAACADPDVERDWIEAVVAALEREVALGRTERSMLLVKRGEGVMYHASRSANRDSIARHGLDWRLMSASPGIAGSAEAEWPGIFLCTDLEGALFFAGMPGPGPADVWSARVDGLWLEGAPDADGGGSDDWMIALQPIGPDRIELVRRDVMHDSWLSG
jgi:hypothetical protein